MISLYGLESVLEKVGNGLIACNGLTESAKGLFIATLVKRLNRPMVVVCDKAVSAEKMFSALKFFMGEQEPGAPELLYFPAWEVLPYENISPHPEVSGARLSTMIKLTAPKTDFVIVTTIEAMAYRTMPFQVMKNTALSIDIGDNISHELLSDHLVSYGYRRVDLVEERGEFSIRGGIVDIYQGIYQRPARIELFGEDVESIRLFDPDSQRSKEKIDTITVIPFREVFYEGVEEESIVNSLRGLGEKLSIDHAKIAAAIESIQNRQFFEGMERLLPLFSSATGGLFDYLPDSTAFIINEPDHVESQAESFYGIVQKGYAEAIKRDEPVAEPDSLTLSKTGLVSMISRMELVRLGELAVTEEKTVTVTALRPPRYAGDVSKFIADLRSLLAEDFTVILAGSTEGGARRLVRALNESDLSARLLTEADMPLIIESLCEAQPSLFDGPLFVIPSRLDEGFILRSDKWAVITYDEILGISPRVSHRAKKGKRSFSVGLRDLAQGDLVAHRTHGVGRYIGAREMTIADRTDEYLELEYAERQKLYLPIASIGLLKKYSGGGGQTPALDRMGGITWKKTKAKVKKNLLAMAEKLLKIQVARELGGGYRFSEDENAHREFSDTFEFEPTVDQLSAINDVSCDMQSAKPMDRLICGDVGYGKTEVAMRAAFKAVYDGKQVAVLAPTTLLAQQHYLSFAERFSAFPVTIDVLSRFKSKKEQKQIVENTSAGKVDILIGTHRLLQKDIAFNDLGLIVIDEEQRFGVTHKEKLKRLRKNADILTLTATPIPRTLHTSMVGIRDLSVIETPPQNRLSIQNFIVKFSDKMISEAVTRELDRGGQIFFVHNQVRSIHAMERHLNKIAPEARTAVAHGQMPEKELEQVMLDFVSHKKDMLISSAIIESGLDIPSANTILINRADRFGLAQLYQLRGRVGRDRHRAYCYFITPGLSSITELAQRRLKAIEELSELGSGFRLAARDMEIRGAGNLLGPQQSGHIDVVGFDTYCEMLEDTVRELKGEPRVDRFEVAMNISYQGRISPDYVPGLNQRMELYNRISDCCKLNQLDDIMGEMADRFGKIPEETDKLFGIIKLRILSMILKITKVDMIRDRLYLLFSNATDIQPDKLLISTRQSGAEFRFTSENCVEFTIKGAGWKERLESAISFLALLGKANNEV